jgi:hypothetical protein
VPSLPAERSVTALTAVDRRAVVRQRNFAPRIDFREMWTSNRAASEHGCPKAGERRAVVQGSARPRPSFSPACNQPPAARSVSRISFFVLISDLAPPLRVNSRISFLYPPSLAPRFSPRSSHGTVVERCPRQKPTFSGLRLKTLFHRSENLFRARPAPPKKVEKCG